MNHGNRGSAAPLDVLDEIYERRAAIKPHQFINPIDLGLTHVNVVGVIEDDRLKQLYTLGAMLAQESAELEGEAMGQDGLEPDPLALLSMMLFRAAPGRRADPRSRHFLAQAKDKETLAELVFKMFDQGVRRRFSSALSDKKHIVPLPDWTVGWHDCQHAAAEGIGVHVLMGEGDDLSGLFGDHGDSPFGPGDLSPAIRELLRRTRGFRGMPPGFEEMFRPHRHRHR